MYICICIYGEIRKQRNGGAIGVKAAGYIASIFMIWWDRRFQEEVKKENLDMRMYTRYVDDETIVCKAVPECSGNINQAKDERTMKKLQEIGNSIHPSIQLTIDYASNNENGRIPILDTEQWIENVEVGNEIKPQIIHSHYTKPMASKHVIHHDSAIPYRSKINIPLADLVRIMKKV